MRIPTTRTYPTTVIARVPPGAVHAVAGPQSTQNVTLVPSPPHRVVTADAASAYAQTYRGESGFAHVDAPNEVITSLAAVRGYAAQLASVARESERLGRMLDVMG